MRTFVSIDITEPSILDGIRKLQAELVPPEPDTVKLSNMEKLHITLQFVGEVSDEERRKIAYTLSRIRFAPFDLEIGGEVGAFPDAKSPRVVWVGMRTVGGDDDGSGLQGLARRVSDELAAIGYVPDFPFNSHITVLRVNEGGAGAVSRVLDGRPAEKVFGVQRVDRFKLKESRKTPDGHVFADLAVVEGVERQ